MIVETEKLAKRFGLHEAVHGLDLTVPQGAALALVGPNGAGKTTTLRLLMNLLRPDGGSARVLGVDSRKLGYREFQRIGYVSENQRLPKGLTIDQFFAFLRPQYPTWDMGLEAELRDRLDLPGNQKIGRLSHGMRMKAALASALVFRPNLLVLDEPLSGLDPLVRDEVMEGMLSQAEDMTVLISSHELAEIEGAATHVAFIDRGRLLFQETMEFLLGRFRDVSVILPEGQGLPRELPPTWLNRRHGGSTFNFIDIGFAGEPALAAAVRERFGPAARLDIRGMPLREVSKTMMRQVRKEARA